MSHVFGTKSKALLAECHPLLVRVMTRALELSPQDFSILQAYRGEVEQNAAFAAGNSKVKYPNSAHNQTMAGRPCACACDVLPYPFGGWEAPASRAAWTVISEAVFKAAAEIGTHIRWGGGVPDKSFNWDLPHFELHPWREHRNGQ